MLLHPNYWGIRWRVQTKDKLAVACHIGDTEEANKLKLKQTMEARELDRILECLIPAV